MSTEADLAMVDSYIAQKRGDSVGAWVAQQRAVRLRQAEFDAGVWGDSTEQEVEGSR